MITIALQKGWSCFIDDIDREIIKGYGWHAHTDRHGKTYVVARIRGTNKRIKMHRLLLGSPVGIEVDHKDGNGLNNQRHNLRLSTHQQNCRNVGKTKSNKSGYKGVCWNPRLKKWIAQATVTGKVRHLGVFETPEEAADRYDFFITIHYGDFAVTNRKMGLLKDPVPEPQSVI